MFNANILKNRNASPFRTTTKKKQIPNPANDPACFHPEVHQGNTHSSSTNLPATAAPLPSAQVPKAGPSITLNSSSSWISTINQSPSPTDSAKGPRSITSPDGLLSHPRAVTCPPPSTLPPRTSLPAQTLAGSLTSEPLHTSRFTTVTAGGGRGLTIGTHFFGGMCVNIRKCSNQIITSSKNRIRERD